MAETDDSFKSGPWTFLYFEQDAESGKLGLSRHGRGWENREELVDVVWGTREIGQRPTPFKRPIDFSLLLPSPVQERIHPLEF